MDQPSSFCLHLYVRPLFEKIPRRGVVINASPTGPPSALTPERQWTSLLVVFGVYEDFSVFRFNLNAGISHPAENVFELRHRSLLPSGNQGPV